MYNFPAQSTLGYITVWYGVKKQLGIFIKSGEQNYGICWFLNCLSSLYCIMLTFVCKLLCYSFFVSYSTFSLGHTGFPNPVCFHFLYKVLLFTTTYKQRNCTFIVTGNYQQALETYKTIHKRFPENVECKYFLPKLHGLKNTTDCAPVELECHRSLTFVLGWFI